MSSSGSLREVRRRIRSVENTKKITRAMEMVAAAKLRRFQDLLESARPYTEKMEELIDILVTDTLIKGDGHLKGNACAVVVFTSDTGLCGTYNGDLERFARDFLARGQDREVRFVFVGKHGANAFRNAGAGLKPAPATLATFSDLRVSRVEEILEGLRKVLETAFQTGTVSEVQAVYTKMESLSRYHPTVERILPVTEKSAPSETSIQWILEPDREIVFQKLLPAVFEARLRFIFYHALLTEQIARMTAMRQATQNAEEMVDELTLLRNKARQAAITKEIIEVVSGSRALKLK